MFIVWGKKHVYRKLGYVADFCPICRKPRAFELKRIGLAGHVYYITAGEGELVGHERTCLKCATILNANPANYASVSKKALTITELIKLTFPDIRDVHSDRLELEEKVQKTPALLTAEERDALIKSPFYILSPLVERRFASTHLDMEIGIAIVVAILLMTMGPAIVGKFAPDDMSQAVLVCIGIGASLVIWQLITAGRRYVQRQVAPILGITLKPLQPKESELLVVLAELKQLKHKMASKLKVTDIQKYL